MEVFAALADDTRRRIIELLAHEELLAGEIAAHFGCSRPAISHHLKVLREAGLVRSRVDAQRRAYSVDPAGLDAVEAWAATQRRFWNAQLDRLARRVERDLAANDLPPAAAPPEKGTAP
jgi:DNA-binding transcriptional ArsR family regulator